MNAQVRLTRRASASAELSRGVNASAHLNTQMITGTIVVDIGDIGDINADAISFTPVTISADNLALINSAVTENKPLALKGSASVHWELKNLSGSVSGTSIFTFIADRVPSWNADLLGFVFYGIASHYFPLMLSIGIEGTTVGAIVRRVVTSQERNSDITDLISALNGKADNSAVPTKTSQLENDSGYLTLSTLPIYNGGVS